MQIFGCFFVKYLHNCEKCRTFASAFALKARVLTKTITHRAFSSAGLEHLPYKQRVGGSNPSTPTRELKFFGNSIWNTQVLQIEEEKQTKRFICASKSVSAVCFDEGAVVQLVRISACHAGGREFESRRHRKKGITNVTPFLFLLTYGFIRA